MKKWYLIDDCTTKKGAVFTEELGADTREEARATIYETWNALTTHDQSLRDSYTAVYADLDEDGGVDYESITDEVRL